MRPRKRQSGDFHIAPGKTQFERRIAASCRNRSLRNFDRLKFNPRGYIGAGCKPASPCVNLCLINCVPAKTPIDKRPQDQNQRSNENEARERPGVARVRKKQLQGIVYPHCDQDQRHQIEEVQHNRIKPVILRSLAPLEPFMRAKKTGRSGNRFQFLPARKRRDIMARSAAILGKADKFETMPAAQAAQDTGGEFERLNTVRWHHNIGPGEEAPAAAEAFLGPVQNKAPIAQHRAHQSGGCAQHREADQNPQSANNLRQGPKTSQPCTRPRQARLPAFRIPNIKRKKEIELLNHAGKNRHDCQREFIDAKQHNAFRAHGENGRAIVSLNCAYAGGAIGLR